MNQLTVEMCLSVMGNHAIPEHAEQRAAYRTVWKQSMIAKYGPDVFAHALIAGCLHHSGDPKLNYHALYFSKQQKNT
ncbi:MAG: hypothetical protein ABJL54_16125 [Halioglobus sp.]